MSYNLVKISTSGTLRVMNLESGSDLGNAKFLKSGSGICMPGTRGYQEIYYPGNSLVYSIIFRLTNNNELYF